MSWSDRCAWWMLIASSSQIPRGTARRRPRPASVIAGEDEQRGARLRVRLAASRQAAARAEEIGLAGAAEPLHNVRHEFPASGLTVCTRTSASLRDWSAPTLTEGGGSLFA